MNEKDKHGNSENVKKSKEAILNLIEDSKGIFDDIHYDRNQENDTVRRIRLKDYTPDDEIDLIYPSTSKEGGEYIKYEKITFDTQAILHHYPQEPRKNKLKLKLETENIYQNKNIKSNKPTPDNNNDIATEISDSNVIANDTNTKKEENLTNNNRSLLIDTIFHEDNSVTAIMTSVKIPEEKLV